MNNTWKSRLKAMVSVIIATFYMTVSVYLSKDVARFIIDQGMPNSFWDYVFLGYISAFIVCLVCSTVSILKWGADYGK